MLDIQMFVVLFIYLFIYLICSLSYMQLLANVKGHPWTKISWN